MPPFSHFKGPFLLSVLVLVAMLEGCSSSASSASSCQEVNTRYNEILQEGDDRIAKAQSGAMSQSDALHEAEVATEELKSLVERASALGCQDDGSGRGTVRDPQTSVAPNAQVSQNAEVLEQTRKPSNSFTLLSAVQASEEELGGWKLPDLIKQLLNDGAAPNAKDEKGSSVICYLAMGYEEADTDALNIMIKAGADVRSKNANGDTALHFCQNPDSVRALVAAGAQVNLKDRDGESPLSYVLGTHSDWRKYSQNGSITNSEPVDRSLVVEALVTGGADVNDGNADGDRPAHLACRSDDSKSLQVLLKHGANLSIKNHDGHDVAQVAKASRSWNCMHLLENIELER